MILRSRPFFVKERSMLTQEIRDTFHSLKVTGQRYGMDDKHERDCLLISYLLKLIDDRVVTEPEDIGFCYWNLSDNYALTRNGTELAENHRRFVYHTETMAAKYVYWSVSDGTQRIVLEQAGYSDFWWNLYRKANETHASGEGYDAAEFAAHRSALYLMRDEKANERHEYAAEQFSKYLNRIQYTPSYEGCCLMYNAMCLRAFDRMNGNPEEWCESFYKELTLPEQKWVLEPGEWLSFSESFTDRRWLSNVGICAVVNACIDTGKQDIAGRIYVKARANGLPVNRYIEKRI